MIKPRYQVSEAGLELIMSFEGYRACAAQLADGRWTIGYGHTKTARPGVTISRSDARILLIYDMAEIGVAMQELVFAPLNQNQIDALASFAFNIGVDSFTRSGVLRQVNQGALLQAACAIDLWRRAEIQGQTILVDALVRRRAAEKALFLTPVTGWTPAPSPVVRGQLDEDIGGAVPATQPRQVYAPLDGPHATAELLAEPAAALADQTAEHPGDRLLYAGEAISAHLQTLFPEVVEAPVEPEPQLSPFAPEPSVLSEDALATPLPFTPEPAVEAEAVALITDAAHEPHTPPWDTEPLAASETPFILEPEATTEPAEPEPEGAVLDEEPTMFRPIPVEHALFETEPAKLAAPVETPAEAQPSQTPIAAPADPAPRSIAPEPAPPAQEPLRRSTLFPNLDARIDAPDRFRTPARFAAFEVTELPRESRSPAPLFLLGLFGLVVFTGAAYWTFTTRAAGGLASPLVLGGLLALVGIASVVASVYILVHRFLGHEV